MTTNPPVFGPDCVIPEIRFSAPVQQVALWRPTDPPTLTIYHEDGRELMTLKGPTAEIVFGAMQRLIAR